MRINPMNIMNFKALIKPTDSSIESDFNAKVNGSVSGTVAGTSLGASSLGTQALGTSASSNPFCAGATTASYYLIDGLSKNQNSTPKDPSDINNLYPNDDNESQEV